jgi:multidrug resistance efflux pump
MATFTQPSGVSAAGPPEPPRSPGAFTRWRARIVVLLMILIAAYVGLRIAQYRSPETRLLDIGSIAVTADPVSVESTLPGRLVKVSVRADDRVTAGQELARIVTTTTTATGGTVDRTRVISAPIAGVVAEDPAPLGTSLQSGQVFVHLYDPTQLRLIGAVQVQDLPRLAPGMTVTLKGDDLPTMEATVLRVLPRIDDRQSPPSTVAADHLAVQLTPNIPAQLALLVPGLKFVGTVDTKSVPGDARRGFYAP